MGRHHKCRFLYQQYYVASGEQQLQNSKFGGAEDRADVPLQSIQVRGAIKKEAYYRARLPAGHIGHQENLRCSTTTRESRRDVTD